MKKIILSTLVTMVFLVPATSFSQSLKLAAGISKGNSNQQLTVQLKIIDNINVINNGKLNIMRKENGGNWKKINESPLMRKAIAKTDDFTKDQSMKRYANFVFRKPATGSQEKNAKSFTGVLLLNDNRMAEYAGCYFEDNTVSPGVSYTYKVTDAAKNDADLSQPVTVTVNAKMELIPGLVTKQKEQDIYLNWETNDSYFGYKVYRRSSADGNPELISDGPVAPGRKGLPYLFTDRSLKPGTTYYYQVSGIDFLNNESAMSDLVKLTVIDATPVAAVANLRNERKHKTIHLTWQPVKDKKATGYNVYRSTEAEKNFKKINAQLLPLTATSYDDLPPTEGTAYLYTVETVGTNGNASRSDFNVAVLPDMTAPAKPIHLKAVTRPALAILTWEKGKETDLNGYWIYRAPSKKREYMTLVNNAPVTGNSYSDSLPVTSTNEYVYAIQAVDNGFNKSVLSDTVVAVVPDVTAPRIVQGLQGKMAAGVVELNWKKLPEADVTDYYIYRSEDSTGNNFQQVNSAGIRTTKFSEKTKKEFLRYYVIAKDKAGNQSAPSRIVSLWAGIDTSGMIPAQALSITKNDRDSSTVLTWRGAVNSKGFVVFRKTGDETDFTAITELITEAKYKDSATEPGSSIYFIRSFFADGSYRDSDNVKN